MDKIASDLCEERTSRFYSALAEDALMMAGRLQAEEHRSTILEVAAAFARIAARLSTEERDCQALNAVIIESNVELYLSKAYRSLGAEERDRLLRIVANEEAR